MKLERNQIAYEHSAFGHSGSFGLWGNRIG